MWGTGILLLSLAAGGVLGAGVNTNSVVPNATSSGSAVTATPLVIYQDQVAGNGNIAGTTTSTQAASQTARERFEWTKAVSIVSATALSYTIPLNAEEQIRAVCWYPVSGSYGDLARYLFYATLLFALVGRTHQWLVVGALGFSLTYSAAAAVHACVLVWSGQPSPDPDMWAALGIVSLAAALAVPLLNWSSTIKNLGKDREENSVGRTIIVYWACFIFIAFLSLWTGYLFRQYQISSGHTSSLYFSVKAYSADPNISCSPTNGILDLTAGQQQGWADVYITEDFIDANGCADPCNSIVNEYGTPLRPILRDPKDLIPMDAKQVNHFMENNLTRRQSDAFTLFNVSIVLGLFLLTWVVAQGITIVLFGRRKPSQVRNFVYVRLCKMFAGRRAAQAPLVTETGRHNSWEFDPGQHKVASFFAKSIATVFYLWSWSASIISILMAILAIMCTEYIMHQLPQSDRNFEIDQWGSWAATALVVLVAFSYRFQGIGEDVLIRFLNSIVDFIYRRIHGRSFRNPNRRRSAQSFSEITNRSILWENLKDSMYRKTTGLWQDIRITTSNEWKENMDFLYRNPWHTAFNNQGHAHQRRRRVIASEIQQFPSNWQLEHDNWMEVEDFIEAVRRADRERRRLHGKGYLWQPRVTEEAPLRRRFDTDAVKDIFRGRGDQSAPHSRSSSMGPAKYSMITELDPPRGLALDDDTVDKTGLEMAQIATVETSSSSSEVSPRLVSAHSPPPPKPRRTVTFSDETEAMALTQARPAGQGTDQSSNDIQDPFRSPQIPSRASSSPIIRATDSGAVPVRPVRHSRTMPISGSLPRSTALSVSTSPGNASPDLISPSPPLPVSVAQRAFAARSQTPNSERDLSTSLGSSDSQPLLARVMAEDDQQQRYQRQRGPLSAEQARIRELRLQEEQEQREQDDRHVGHQRSDVTLGGSLSNIEPTMPRETI